MKVLKAIEQELINIGYQPEAIIRDYTFADVLSKTGVARRVSLAVFTQTPESYRSAAFGVIDSDDDNETGVLAYRALGAPLLLSIGADDVGVWRVGGDDRPRLLDRVALDALPQLFRHNAKRWAPLSVHRAKSLGQTHQAYQLSFVDLGLLPAIEREVHAKLDRALEDVIRLLLPVKRDDLEEAVFRTTFRLLAAKILEDRGHAVAGEWDEADVTSVLNGIEGYYRLSPMRSAQAVLPTPALSDAWSHLRTMISFRNISSDDLAFVYENTLVSADTRKRFGTHSTPRQVAEYILDRIDLARFDANELQIYEPFTGAGVFLVSALRHLRDRLPTEWSPEARHKFLTDQIKGSEIDAFACEVTSLSLILADYPNANEWAIDTEDLFKADTLSQALAGTTVVLCNPPFEDFTKDERQHYSEASKRSVSKPMAVLHTVLDHAPSAIGFVLPHGFLRQQKYAALRERVVALYEAVELLSLPDRVFAKAGFESAVLIATDRRVAEDKRLTKLVSTIVTDADRSAFLDTGHTSDVRRRTRTVEADRLWLGAFDELWEYLENYPRLRDHAKIYRGLQWRQQREGVRDEPGRGYRRGVYRPAGSLEPFRVLRTKYLNFDREAAMYPGPLKRPWDKPKILANNQRLSRGPWRLAAAFDTSGLAASQQFFGIWPNSDALSGEVLEAILNGPLANAFLTEHASGQHFTNVLMKQIPLPRDINEPRLCSLVLQYCQEVKRFGALDGADDSSLNSLLIQIDAEVLRAYDLPPRLERRLLEYFRGHIRPVAHHFTEWVPETMTACIPLHEYLTGEYRRNAGPWVLEVFTPAPDEEAAALAEIID